VEWAVTDSTQTENSPTISSLSQNSNGTGVAVIVYGSDIGFTDTVNFGTITIVPDQTYKVANQIRFIIPTTLNACTTGAMCRTGNTTFERIR